MLSVRQLTFLGFAILATPLAAQGEAALVGPEWRVETLPDAVVGGDRRPTLRIRPDGRLQGSTGCNRFDSAYSLNGAGIEFGPLVTTRMACPAGLQAVEARFVAAMAAVTGWRMEAGQLLLTGTEGVVLLRLSRAP